MDVGLSRDLIYHVGRSFGFYLNDGKDLVSLPEYIIGAQITGSDSTYSVSSVTPEKDISREIWKRILNNMPFFLKTRGTIRSMKGLINCYGIPSSIEVLKYGQFKIKMTVLTEEEKSYKVRIQSSQYIQTTEKR